VKKNKAQRFEARLETGEQSLGWTIARVPFAPSDVWSEMLRLRVRGTVNGYAFRTSLFPDSRAGDGGGAFFLLVNKEMQKGAGVKLGGVAEFVLEPDMEAREAELPDELAVLLDEERGLRNWYDELSEYTRRELGKWVTGVKSDEARMKRATQEAERLLAAMEAETELPPMIVAAFKRRPKARLGWEKMTLTQKRGELMAVFYYQTIEAMQKRVEKLCDGAEKRV
jgi:uncharacterized protein YdeI (YjbR/CyaY-like superfamily)